MHKGKLTNVNPPRITTEPASAGNRMVAGVCAGIADYFGWDPTLLRIVYVLATIFTAFAGIIIYIILWIVMPERRPGDGYEDRMNNRLH